MLSNRYSDDFQSLAILWCTFLCLTVVHAAIWFSVVKVLSENRCPATKMHIMLLFERAVLWVFDKLGNHFRIATHFRCKNIDNNGQMNIPHL